MLPKFIAFNRSAVENMISARDLFSFDFPRASEFYSVITCACSMSFPAEKVFTYGTDKGVIFWGVSSSTLPPQKSLLVFDCSQCNLFAISKPQDILQIIQKTLRFSLRYWNKQGFPSTEKIISDTHKAVLFPFGLTSAAPLRIVLERNVDSTRMDKREYINNLLAYKLGTDQAPASNEMPSLNIFRNVVESLDKANAQCVTFFNKKTAPDKKENSSPLSLVTLSGFQVAHSEDSPFESIRSKLSTSQLEVLKTNRGTPIRIQGAAGTGKTLILMMKLLKELMDAHSNAEAFKALFLTHSTSSKESIVYMLESLGAKKFIAEGLQSYEVKTLYELFLEKLGHDITTDEILEREAEDAKAAQEMYIEESLKKILPQLLKTAREDISKDFLDFIESSDNFAKIKMLAHEFSVQIKGKASGKIDLYLDLPALSTGVPTKKPEDKSFVFSIYREYENTFDLLRQFDADDIAISVFGKLSGPIWQRRRAKEGYDFLLIDETHLFNLNELAAIHFLPKSLTEIPIAFAIDTAQAIGELAWDSDSISTEFCPKSKCPPTKMSTVFRGTLPIIKLAASILTTGSNMFTGIISQYDENSFYGDEEEINIPEYFLVDNDQDLVGKGIALAQSLVKDYQVQKEGICFISFSQDIYSVLNETLKSQRMGPVEITRRGDVRGVLEAQKNKKFVSSLPEYVGGLEFQAVILLGVDEGRVPAESSDIAHLYFKHTAINKLYVSVTRSRRFVYVLGNRGRGQSPCLRYSIANSYLSLVE